MSDMTLPTSMSALAIATEREYVVPRLAQRGLLVLLAVIYGGGFLFLVTISPLLLYGFYAAIGGLIALRCESLTQLWRDTRPVTAYLIWLLVFWSWGVLVSPFPAEVFPEVIRIVFRNLLFIIGVAVAITDVRSYRLFARLVMVAIFVNYLIMLRQLNDPAFAVDFARRLGEESYTANSVRPGGLWINPDEAAFSLLFGLLIIARERGPIALLVRIAAIYCIYLTASRSGNYIMLGFGAIYLAFQLSQGFFSFRRAMVLVNVIALVYAVWLGLYFTDNLPRYDVSQDFALSRILDITESNTDYTRTDLTDAVFQIALNAPWHGYGALGLQDAATSTRYFQSALPGLGAHNIYLAIWGETGVLGLTSYVAVLLVMLILSLRLPMPPQGRVIVALMWLGYFVRGLTWHSQLLSGTGIVTIAVLLCYPRVAAMMRDKTIEAPLQDRKQFVEA